MSESAVPIVIIEPTEDDDDEREEAEEDDDSPQKSSLKRVSTQPPPYPESEARPPMPSDSKRRKTRVMSRIRQSKADSSGFMNFLCQIISIIYDTFGFTILLTVLVAVPISMIVFGSIHLNDCPRKRYVPIYLLVTGCFGVARLVIDILQRMASMACSETTKKTPRCIRKMNHALNTLVGCFLLGWFIAGNVWIFSIYHDFEPDDSTSSRYCYRVLYYFAFWITMATYILMAFSIFCFVLTLILACIMHK